MSDWVVYIVRAADSTLYTGITNDLERRIAAHQAGSGAKYLRGRTPLALAYVERDHTRGSALRREAQIKKLTRRHKQALIDGHADS